VSDHGLIAVLGVFGGALLLVVGKVCLDLASKQVQGWLFDLPFVVLRVARRRLPAALRVTHHDDESVPELKYILFDEYAIEPIVGLAKGLRFALGHVRGAKKLAREVELGRKILRPELLPARWELVARRSVDLLVTTTALAVLVIPMLLIAMAIRLGGRGPVLYRLPQLGRGGRPFMLYKFRTNRATAIGSILQRTNLDELPQLLNVLRGQMALVGPRACTDWEAELYPAIFAKRFDVQPGLTGLWQFTGRSTISVREMLELDLAYVRSWSFWTYLRILVRIILALMPGRRGR
jgi:lipopolysaccharide/colanic/teichoic acid biosynthesis glycosyltransferase